jgi:hypothetical protein
MSVEFNLDDGIGRTECYLQTANHIHLGAESMEYIVGHLLEILEPSTHVDISLRSSDKLKGKDVIWVMSLAPLRHVLYVTTDDVDQTWLWQDARESPPHIIGELVLTQFQREVWHSKLRAIREEFPQIFSK